MNVADSLQRDYRVAFLGYLMQRGEAPLRTAYEIGRRALVDGVSMLSLSKIHHEVFGGLLVETKPADQDDLVGAASEFFLEVLATYHMTHDASGG